MIVCDTSVLSYLVPAGLHEQLARRYGKVVIPETVRVELSRAEAPPSVRAWIANPPAWLEVRTISPLVVTELDPGESEAIPLAEALGCALIVDDRAARDEATRRGLAITGTLGFLAREARDGHLDYDGATKRLLAQGFYATTAIIELLRPKG